MCETRRKGWWFCVCWFEFSKNGRGVRGALVFLRQERILIDFSKPAGRIHNDGICFVGFVPVADSCRVSMTTTVYASITIPQFVAGMCIG